MFPIISNNKSSHLILKFNALLESSCSCFLLSKFLLNSCRTTNVRHAKWTDWPGSPWEAWQVHPRQRKYGTYTWFLDLGIDSKAFCFHCWLVIVCFTWGKETIIVISLSLVSSMNSLLALSGLCTLVHTRIPQEYHRKKHWVPNPMHICPMTLG